MRKFKNYKVYSSLKIELSRMPTRLLKFKKSKWNIVKKMIQTKLLDIENSENLIEYNDSTKIKVHTIGTKFVKRHHFFKRINNIKIYLKYEDVFNTKFFSNILLRKLSHFETIRKSFCKPLYKLEILLKELNFFSSVIECHQAMYNSLIKVNNNICNKSIFLKKGDIIDLDFSILKNTNYNREKRQGFTLIIPFIELDYYLGKIIIIKDYHDLSEEDVYLLSKDDIDYYFFNKF